MVLPNLKIFKKSNVTTQLPLNIYIIHTPLYSPLLPFTPTNSPLLASTTCLYSPLSHIGTACRVHIYIYSPA